MDTGKATSLNAEAGVMAVISAFCSVLAPHPQKAPNSGASAATHLRGVIAAILNQFSAIRTDRSFRPKAVRDQSKNASVRIWVLRFTPREMSSRFSSVIIAPLPTR